MIPYQLNSSTQFKLKLKSPFAQLKKRYLDYCESQQKIKVYWYMKVIIILTCVFMVPSITVMAMATDYFVYYVGVTIFLVYMNVLVHITNLPSKYYVPIYQVTCLLMIVIPLITIMLFGANGTSQIF